MIRSAIEIWIIPKVWAKKGTRKPEKWIRSLILLGLFNRFPFVPKIVIALHIIIEIIHEFYQQIALNSP